MYEAFLKEKQYLLNVSPRTLEWYQQALKWLYEDRSDIEPRRSDRVLGQQRQNNSLSHDWRGRRTHSNASGNTSDCQPDQRQGDCNPVGDRKLKNVVIRMRQAGLSARSINSYRTAINSYLHWLTGSDKACSPQCLHSRIPKMKCEQRVLPVFSAADIQTVMRWKPKKRCDRRLQAIMLTLADTGCRIDEVLSLTWADVDFDNLLITVTGKGNKQRRIPFSFELRKVLWHLGKSSQASGSNHDAKRTRWNAATVDLSTRYTSGFMTSGSSSRLIEMNGQLVFAARAGQKLGRRNILRDVKLTCTKLGIQYPERTLHALRHTFAINYLRRGGSVFHLQKVLGHTDLTMTRRYANLMTEDLQQVHQQVSLLHG